MVTPLSPRTPDEPERINELSRPSPLLSIRLDELAKPNGRGFGYKAANLYQLQLLANHLRICVPPFLPLSHAQIFAQIVAYYPDFLSDYKAFQASLGSPPCLTPKGKALLERIRAHIETTPFHLESIRDFLLRASSSYLTLRSTGEEDSDTLSNPGGNESYNYVPLTQEDVSKYIGKVVASYFGEKSILQRIASCDPKLLSEDPFVPVLIQEMVAELPDGETPDDEIPRSGVMSVHPELSEISVGLGHNEGVVTSAVPTDTYRFTMHGIPRAVIRDKKERFRGVRTSRYSIVCKAVPCQGAIRKKPALSLLMQMKLQDLAKELYTLYGKPMDVEFTIVNNTIYLLQARPLILPTPKKPPSYIKNPEGVLRGETLLSGGSYVRPIEDRSHLLVFQTIQEAYTHYTTALSAEERSNIEGIILRKTAPITSHQAIFFASQGLPLLVIPEGEISFPCLLDPSQGMLAKSGIATNGRISYPIGIQYSLKEFPFNKRRILALQTKILPYPGKKITTMNELRSALEAENYPAILHFLHARISDPHVLPVSKLELVIILENVVNILEHEQRSDPLYTKRLIEACLFQTGEGIIGGSSFVRVQTDLKSARIASSILGMPYAETTLPFAPFVRIGMHFLRDDLQEKWRSFLPYLQTLPEERVLAVQDVLLRLEALHVSPEFINTQIGPLLEASQEEIFASLETITATLLTDIEIVENLSGDELSQMQSLAGSYQISPPYAKLLYIQKAKELVTSYDLKIKACTGATTYASDKEKVQAFLAHLHTYRKMMITVLKMANYTDREILLYNECTAYLPGSLEDITEEEAKRFLTLSPEFDLLSNLFLNQNTIKYTIEQPLPPQSLEDCFTLIHQNMNETLSVLATKSGLSADLLPIPMANYAHSLPNRTKLIKIELNGSTIHATFFLPLRDHGMELILSYDRNKDLITTSCSIYGGNEEDRWHALQKVVTDAGEVLPELQVTSSHVDATMLRFSLAPVRAKMLDLLQIGQYFEALSHYTYSVEAIPKSMILHDLIPTEGQTKEMVLPIINRQGMAFIELSDTLREDPEIIEAALRQNPKVIDYLFQKDQTPDRVMQVLPFYPTAFRYLPPALQTPEMVLNAVSKDGASIQYARNDLLTEEFIKSAIQASPRVLPYLPSRLKTYSFLLTLLKINGLALEFIPYELRDDKDLIRAALTQTPEALAFIGHNMQSESLVRAAIKKGLQNRDAIAPHLRYLLDEYGEKE